LLLRDQGIDLGGFVVEEVGDFVVQSAMGKPLPAEYFATNVPTAEPALSLFKLIARRR
jgi:hypothetical protein